MIPIILIILGLLIRSISFYNLQRDVIWKVECPRKLITTGIYSIVRHPMYTGGIILYFGLVWLTSNFWSAFVISSLVISFALDRIDREEAILERYFPEYKKYKKKTKMLIPFLM